MRSVTSGNLVPVSPRRLKGALQNCRNLDNDNPGRTTFTSDDEVRLTDPGSPDAQAVNELARRLGDSCVVHDAPSARRVAAAINAVLKSRVVAFPVWGPFEGYTVVVCPLDNKSPWAFDPEIRKTLIRTHTNRGRCAAQWVAELRGSAQMHPVLCFALELFEECKTTGTTPNSLRAQTTTQRAAVLVSEGWLHVADDAWAPPQVQESDTTD